MKGITVESVSDVAPTSLDERGVQVETCFHLVPTGAV